MKLVEKINNILLFDDKVEKEISIGNIGDMLEYGSFDGTEIIEGINLLLSHVVLEKDGALKESILHTIHNAVVYQGIAPQISLDVLLPYVSTFKE